MELVVGASEATMRSLLDKLGSLLSQEYTLIRGVDGDLQYINDELATMQSFLRSVGAARHGHDDLTKDWMKQIRDLTYDIEDCIDDSGIRLHGLPTSMTCYFLLNSIYEVLTWWPRREIATRISTLKMRAQQIGERRERYGVNKPEIGAPPENADKTPICPVSGFEVADNQGTALLQLIITKKPVGVEGHMGELTKRVTCIVGFGGVGKTAIANEMYKRLGDQFVHRAQVTVSQSSDVVAILRSIKSQVKQQPSNHESKCVSGESRVAAAVKGVRDHVSRGTSALMAKCCNAGTSQELHHGTKLQLKKELEEHFNKKSYLVLIDDVWSANMLESIIKALPDDTEGSSRIIVTTRFHAVATSQRDGDIRSVKGLNLEESRELFEQALNESKVSSSKGASASTPKPEEGDSYYKKDANPEQAASKSKGRKDSREKTSEVLVDPTLEQSKVSNCVNHVHKLISSKDGKVPDLVWKMCGGLPLAIVTMAGLVACTSRKKEEEWFKFCGSLFPELAKEVEPGRYDEEIRTLKELTQEEVGMIISHCYNDMPADIKTCSLYLSIFPKSHRISKKRLIRRWIAEGFVCEKQGLGAEEVAEAYFNYIVRRKIIQPVEHCSNGKVKKCIVHDMVLEHIVAKASEENFITVVGGNWLMKPPSSKVRRLSLQGSDSKRAKDTEMMNLSHVRSLTMFGSLNNQLHSHLFKFGIVQVLDVEGCTGFKQHHILEICRMSLLKYLSLRKTDIKQLPNSIGKLKNLETLDVRETNVVELPNTICQLEKLINILGGDKTTRMALKLPEELKKKKKKMKALRILSGIELVDGSADLHYLTELRKLAIYKLKTMGGGANFKELSSSIEYLGGYSLQTLIIQDESSEFIKSLDDLSSPPKFLVALELSCKMVKIPNWMKQLHNLSKLTLSVWALRTDNLNHLSELEALFSLTFLYRAKELDRETSSILAENKLSSGGEITVPPNGFKSLKLFRLFAPLLPLMRFSTNAMQQLERLELQYSMLEGLFGAENLEQLKEVHLTSNYKGRKDLMTEAIMSQMKNAEKTIILHQ